MPFCPQDFIQQKIIGTFALPVLSMALLLAYTVLLLIVAFNMLVAIMNDTFNRIKGGEKHELLKLKVSAGGLCTGPLHEESGRPPRLCVQTCEVCLCAAVSCAQALVLVDIESGFSPKQLEEFNR